jgi:hypothetical protein
MNPSEKPDSYHLSNDLVCNWGGVKVGRRSTFGDRLLIGFHAITVLAGLLTLAVQARCRRLSRERFSALALRLLNLPCALKAAIGIGKRTLGSPRRAHGMRRRGTPRPLGVHRRLRPRFPHSRPGPLLPPAGAPGRAGISEARGPPVLRGTASLPRTFRIGRPMSAFLTETGRDMLILSISTEDPSLP